MYPANILMLIAFLFSYKIICAFSTAETWSQVQRKHSALCLLHLKEMPLDDLENLTVIALRQADFPVITSHHC